MHTHTYTAICTHARVPEDMKGKFFALKTEIWNESPFSQYKQPYMIPFQNTQKILQENLRFIRNESKREFFTKHSQVNFLLIRTFFDLDL